jgi:hypothetical protein
MLKKSLQFCSAFSLAFSFTSPEATAYDICFSDRLPKETNIHTTSENSQVWQEAVDAFARSFVSKLSFLVSGSTMATADEDIALMAKSLEEDLYSCLKAMLSESKYASYDQETVLFPIAMREMNIPQQLAPFVNVYIAHLSMAYQKHSDTCPFTVHVKYVK